MDAMTLSGFGGCMSIRIEDLNKLDFTDVIDPGAAPVPPTHPGEVLLHDFMEPLGLSANALARALHVPANRITAIVNGTRGISGDTALRLARYFGGDAQWWMHLQSRHELLSARLASGADIERSVQPHVA